MLLRIPGVYPPQEDSLLLAEALRREVAGGRTSVLDVCCGTGIQSVHAGAAGAGRITAVDIGRRAVANTLINSRLNRVPVRVVRGDLFAPVAAEEFDVVVSNPPYVPAESDELPDRGLARCWDAGQDGRALLDRICTEVSDVLAPGGVLLLMQSALCGEEKTRAMLEEHGLEVEVAARATIPFGPVLRSRRRLLARRGMIDENQDSEEIVVIRASK